MRDVGFQRVGSAPLLDLRAVPWAYQEARSRPTIIFPSVVDTAAWPAAFRQPLDRFYLYYAPHHSLAMGLATAPRLEGPWTPYPGNPVLRLDQLSGLRGHLSSPEPVYRPDHHAAPLWLYCHGLAVPQGGGQQTCLATSTDGLHFAQVGDGPILTATAAQTGDENTAAYVRLFRYGGWWYGLYKAEHAHGLARSANGIHWEHWPRNPVIRPEAAHGEYDRIRHTGLLLRGDRLYIFYSTLTRPDLSREEIKLATLPLGEDWLHWGPLARQGTVFAPDADWEAGDVRDPYPILHNDTLYLFYVGGHEQGIGLTRTSAESITSL